MLNAFRDRLADGLKQAVDSLTGLEVAGTGAPAQGAHVPGRAEIRQAISAPKDPRHGHLAFPVFSLAKSLRRPPADVAEALGQHVMKQPTPPLAYSVIGGFLNFRFADLQLMEVLLSSCESDRMGASAVAQGRRLVIDYSSPNVAKPMHIGHLRATVIGQALRNLAETQGYEVIGLNHLGDWGVQFGKLAWAYRRWPNPEAFAANPFEALYGLYVKFHEEAEREPEIEQLGAAEFKKLEDGDPEVTALWKRFVEISMAEYKRIWDLMGVRHDLVRGESFYNSRLEAVESELETKGLLEESDGAMVVQLDGDVPPCLIRKSDGASLYATRDLASALYRKNELACDLNLYVVGSEQTLHFKQVFQVLEKMGYSWSKDCHHISFGMYRFKDAGKMSSRKGNIIRLDDVLRQAIDSVAQRIRDRVEVSEAKRHEVAVQVGVGAVIFNDLAFDRVKNVDFDWERVLDFEGDSGPYVQYCHVRCASLLRRYRESHGRDWALGQSGWRDRQDWLDAEIDLAMALLQLDVVFQGAFSTFRPNILAQYLLEVCRVFNQFYQKCRILGETPIVEESRMALVWATQRVLRRGLQVLGVSAPDVM